MRQLRVYYSPNPANNRIVPLLAVLGKGKFDFVPLHESPQERMKQLPDLPDHSAFMWGHGYRHHESFYFTASRGVDTKINIDQHEDAEIHGLLNCGSHMYHSRRHNIYPMTGLDSSVKLASLAASEYVRTTKERIALTVDCDVFLRFPAIHEWVTHDPDAPSVLDVVRFVQAVGSRAMCLDLGGLVEYVPDFNFIPSAQPPEVEAIHVFTKAFALYRLGPLYITDREHMLASQHFDALASNMPQPIVDNICSYAVVIYHKILDAFADVMASRHSVGHSSGYNNCGL